MKCLFMCLFWAAIVIAAICCKTSQSIPPVNPDATAIIAKSSFAPVDSETVIAQAHWPGTTLDTLNRGYSIYENRCTSCHKSKAPQNFGAHEWWVIMRQMGHKAKLNPNEDSVVLHYILTKRQAILESVRLPH